MTGREAKSLIKLLLGASGLFAGLSLLSTTPFLAVLMVLSAMSLLLFPAASLSGAVIRQSSRSKQWVVKR